jgi:hypothetical protein
MSSKGAAALAIIMCVSETANYRHLLVIDNMPEKSRSIERKLWIIQNILKAL